MQTVTVAFAPLRQCLINLPAAWTNALLDQGRVTSLVNRRRTNLTLLSYTHYFLLIQILF